MSGDVGELKRRINVTEDLGDFLVGVMIDYGPLHHSDGYDIILKKLTEEIHKIIDEAKQEINKAISSHLEALIEFWKSDPTVPKHLEKYREQYVDAYKCILHNHRERDVFKIKEWFGGVEQK